MLQNFKIDLDIGERNNIEMTKYNACAVVEINSLREPVQKKSVENSTLGSDKAIPYCLA